MRKMKYLLLSVLIFMTIFSLTSITALAEYSGAAGGVSWNIDNEGTLTLSGEGATDDYTLEILPPWYQYRDIVNGIVVESGVKSLGDYVFYGFDNVQSITISSSVETVGYSAFERCTSLTSVTIGNASAMVDGTAFRGCEGLVVDDGSGNKYIAITSNNRYMLKSVANKSATSFSIPSSTVIIGEKAFENSANLQSVTIPNSVISIGYAAFENCTSLTSVQFGTGVKIVGNAAFADCTSLTTVQFTNTPKIVGVRAFDACPLNKSEYDNAFYIGSAINPYMILLSAKNTDISSCTINSSTEVIAALAFAECTKLATVDFPDTLKYVGNSAFNKCSKLYSVDLPLGVEYIGALAFNDCTTLEKLTIADTVEYIGNGAFRGATSLQSVLLPAGLDNLGFNAFRECTALKSVAIKTGIKSIGYKAFEGCTSLLSAYLPNSLLSIGDYAFKGCASIKNMSIPYTVNSIGFGAFASCSGLEGIVLPFVGDKQNGQYPFVGYVFGALNSEDNARVFPENLETVLAGSDIEDGAFDGLHLNVLIIDKTATSVSPSGIGTVTNLYYIGTQNEWSGVTGNESLSPTFLDNDFEIKYDGDEIKTGVVVNFSGFTANCGSLDVLPLIRLESNPIVEIGEDFNIYVYLGSLEASFKSYGTDEVSIVNYSLILEGSIGVKVFVKLSPVAIRNIENVVSTITYKNEVYDDVPLVFANVESDPTLYYAVFYVPAKEMQENITLTVITPMGGTDTETVSVKGYVEYVNENSEYFAESIDLINAMYNYGEYARAYFMGDEIEPNPDLSEIDVEIPSYYAPMKVGDVSGINIYGSSLRFESSTALRHYFKLSSGTSIEDYTFTLDGVTSLTPQKKDNYYYVEIPNILAHKLGDMRVVSVTNGTETAKFVYGPLSFAKIVIEDNLPEERSLALAVKALYKYYVEARKYYKLINNAPIIPGSNETENQIW